MWPKVKILPALFSCNQKAKTIEMLVGDNTNKENGKKVMVEKAIVE